MAKPARHAERANLCRPGDILRIALLLAVALSACQPSLQPAPLPTPAALEVQISAALQPLGEQLRACVLELPGTGLVLLETPAAAMDLERSPLALRWGAGSAIIEYAAVIGEQELTLVIHPDNPLSEIPLEELREIYLGRLGDWPGEGSPGAIEVWSYSRGDDVQEVFETIFFDGVPLVQGTTWLAPDPGAMRTAVAQNPAAIGFLPRSWLDDSLKELPVSGIEPERLSQPILAMSKSEPTGPEKAWLICLQQAPR